MQGVVYGLRSEGMALVCCVRECIEAQNKSVCSLRLSEVRPGSLRVDLGTVLGPCGAPRTFLRDLAPRENQYPRRGVVHGHVSPNNRQSRTKLKVWRILRSETNKQSM